MGSSAALFAYSAAILVGALAGAALPLWRPSFAHRMELMLAFSAGTMLGAGFFHMLPEAVHLGGPGPLGFVVVGFLFLYLLERYVLVHVCEEPEGGCEVHAAMGLAAFIGLSLHTLVDGLALGASLGAGLGMLVFAAIVAHKIPSSLSLAAILTAGHYPRAKVLLMTVAFALMVPLGAGLFLLAKAGFDADRFTPWALAFSAGTFLHLSLADLLPHIHRRGLPRLPSSVALLAGVLAMYGLSFLPGR